MGGKADEDATGAGHAATGSRPAGRVSMRERILDAATGLFYAHGIRVVSAEKIIAEIEVTGPPKDMALPGKLPLPERLYPLIQPSEIKRVRVIQFTGTTPGLINTIVGGDYLINNAIYGEQEVPVVVNLNDAEEWHLSVGMSHAGGIEGHPFHIHVNSFEVISINGVAQPPGTIQDTVWVPPEGVVVVRLRFKQWVGKSVFHCHILPHEDVGMMQNFLILGPEKAGHHMG